MNEQKFNSKQIGPLLSSVAGNSGELCLFSQLQTIRKAIQPVPATLTKYNGKVPCNRMSGTILRTIDV